MEIKNREKILAIALGAAIVFWLGNVLVLKPMAQSWRARSARIAQLTSQMQDGRQLLARGSEVLGRWDRMQTNSLAPTSALAESQLFTAFDGWVRDSGVTQGSFHPQLRETDDNYSVLECRADVTGSMEQIFNFLYDLEKDPIAIRLDSVGLTSRDDNGRQLALVLEMSGLMLPSTQP
jgi:Tfp pilus assembly protein PilO